MERGIDKAIELLEEIQRVNTIQKERGINTIREEMIEKMLFEVQTEVFHALASLRKS